MDRVWELKVYTYKGILPGATHYSGTLTEPRLPTMNKAGFGAVEGVDYPKQWRIEHKMTAEEARAENEKDPTYGGWERFSVTERMDREVLIAEAVSLFRRKAHPGDVLELEGERIDMKGAR